jgi:hypothetical protein
LVFVKGEERFSGLLWGNDFGFEYSSLAIISINPLANNEDPSATSEKRSFFQV